MITGSKDYKDKTPGDMGGALTNSELIEIKVREDIRTADYVLADELTEVQIKRIEKSVPSQNEIQKQHRTAANAVLAQWAYIYRMGDLREIQKMTGALRRTNYAGGGVELDLHDYEMVNSVICQMPPFSRSVIYLHFVDRWRNGEYENVEKYIKGLGIKKTKYYKELKNAINLFILKNGLQ